MYEIERGDINHSRPRECGGIAAEIAWRVIREGKGRYRILWTRERTDGAILKEGNDE